MMPNSNDPVKRIQQQFGTHANDYATSQVHAKGHSLARLLELTQPRRDWVVLDVSTGAGHTAITFAPRVARIVAVDLTPEMLDTARRLASERGIMNIEFKPADAHTLPFDDNCFDLVTNRIALHHFRDARQAITEMARVCKPGGLVALTDNIVPPDKVTAGHINHFERLRDRTHNWAYPIVRLQAMFEDTGLNVEHTESFSKEIEFDSWADRAGANEETKAKLRKWLDEVRDPARGWLAFHRNGDRQLFMLHEAIIIGRKG